MLCLFDCRHPSGGEAALIYTPRMAAEVEPVFIASCSWFIFDEASVWILCPLFNWIFCILINELWELVIYFRYKSLIALQIFSPILFTFLIGLFITRKSFIVMKALLSSFVCVTCAFGVRAIKKLSPNSRSLRCTPRFSSKSLALTFRAMIHFELVFVLRVRWSPASFLCVWTSDCSSHLLKKPFFPTLNRPGSTFLLSSPLLWLANTQTCLVFFRPLPLLSL